VTVGRADVAVLATVLTTSVTTGTVVIVVAGAATEGDWCVPEVLVVSEAIP
jgi:hypothetical protein